MTTARGMGKFVSIPSKREGTCEHDAIVKDAAARLDVSIPSKREGTCELATCYDAIEAYKFQFPPNGKARVNLIPR